MTAVTDGARAMLGKISGFCWMLDDNKVAGSAGTQAGAPLLLGPVSRFTVAAANGSCILKPMLSNETFDMIIVINDSASAMRIFPAAGESINALGANAAFALAAGAVAVLIKAPGTGVGNWRGAVIT